MKNYKWKKFISGALVAVMLAGSLSDFPANASENTEIEENAEAVCQETHEGTDEETAAQEIKDSEIQQEPLQETADEGTNEGGDEEKASYRYVAFPDYKGNIEITVPETDGVATVLSADFPMLYRIDTDVAEELVFEASVRYGYKLEIPGDFADVMTQKQDRRLLEGKWIYSYGLSVSDLSVTKAEPTVLRLTRTKDTVKVNGDGELRLSSLGSSAQGYDEIVLNFTAAKKGSDSIENEKVYYEVKVTAAPREGEELPTGSDIIPEYYYIAKRAGTNTQSKSIKVNDGDLSAPTACTYEFSVRLVLVDKSEEIPDENTSVEAPLNVNLSGNTITKSFATRNLYYEDKLGFTRKNSKIYTGQKNLLAGVVKYSKKASYIHGLTAIAYDSRGGACTGITCTFRNDNDELYVSAEAGVVPGQYKVVVYAGIGEETVAGSPQSGTMYQANTSFALTVQPGIYRIETDGITKQAAVNSRNITFSAVPVGYSFYSDQKAKTQKFTYEIKSAVPDDSESGYTVTEPADKVKENVSVNKNGKVTVKRGYYVDPDTSRNFIAIVITGADFAGNTATATAYVQIVDTVLVPTKIYVTNSEGRNLGTKISAEKADGANIVVLDQNGNNMNRYVTITPTDNAKGTAGVYVEQSLEDGSAKLRVRKISSVTIKATPKDGGRKSKSLKITVKAPYITGGYYYIHDIICDGFSVNPEDFSIKDAKVTYSAPRGTVIKFQQGFTINKTPYLNEWFKWDYKLKGGKLKVDGKYWLITPTAKTAELSVWLKSDSSRSWKVKFTNTDWKTTYESAPKVKLIDGRLYSNKYTNVSDTKYEEDDSGNRKLIIPNQQLTYQYEYGSYDTMEFAKISKAGPDLVVSDFDPEHRTFKLNLEPGNDIKPGSFRYKVAFYKGTTLMNKPATITVKVNRAAPVKITSSYTLKTSQSDHIVLKCTPNGFLPDFDTALLNANVGGRANDFNKYFELAYVADSVAGGSKAVIRFKEDVTEEEREQLKGKNLTGYVKYSYYYGYSYVRNTTARISIKIK